MGFGILFLASSSVPVAVSRDILCIVCLGEIFVFCSVPETVVFFVLLALRPMRGQ